jgi:hypothetical protein
MTSDIKNPDEYIGSLDEERLPVIRKIDKIITSHLKGVYSRNMQYGMISYTIPHSVYPGGYHCKPTDEVPYISLASQKNHVSLYHMGVYTGTSLLEWLLGAFEAKGIKADMGKCCIRFKKMEAIPYEIIEELMKKSSIDDYLDKYRTLDPRNKK